MSNTSDADSYNGRENQVRISKYHSTIVAFFIGTMLTSHIAAIKLISVFGITLTGAFFIYPLIYLLSSLVVEVYGYKTAELLILNAFFVNLFFAIFMDIVIVLPPSPHWKFNEAFAMIFLPETRIVLASLFAFVIADLLFAKVIDKIKNHNPNSTIFARMIKAATISIMIDVTIFITLAYYGKIPGNILIKLIAVAYIKKLLIQIGLFPLNKFLIKTLERLEGVNEAESGSVELPKLFSNIHELRIESGRK